MKVVMPFNYIDDYYWHRYRPQIMPIADRVDELTILAYTGVKPRQDEVPVIMYDRRQGPNDKLEMLRRQFFEMSGMTLFRKINRRREVALSWNHLDYDVAYCLSAGSVQQMLHHYMKKVKPHTKVVHRMRGDGEQHRYYLMKRPQRWIHNWIAQGSLQCYDRHIPINDEMYRKLRKYGIPSEMISSPIGLGVDTTKFKPTHHENERLTCGYFGRLSHEKGIDFLFQLMNQTPEIDYVLLGKRHDPLPPIPLNCTDLGYVQHHRMPDMYAKVDILLLPSYMEGISNIFPEAYASGKPVFCSPQARDPSLPLYGYEQVHNVFYWKTVLYTLMGNVDLLQKKGIEARRWAEGYTWDRFGERIVKEFEKVLK